jgi:hypothetical protein
VIAGLHGLGVEETPSALDQFDAALLQLIRALVLVDLFDGLTNKRAHIRHLDDRRIGADTESGGCANFVRDFCSLEERFTRHATGPGAVASDSVLLDQDYPGAELCRKTGGCQAA